MTALKLITLAILFSILVAESHARSVLSAEQYQRLSSSTSWHDLLHYRPRVFSSKQESQADDDRFFYADNGKQDSLAELKAFVAAIEAAEHDPTNNNQHPACRFPARYQWLSQYMLLPAPADHITCPELDAWLNELNAERITLVYAASYLNSPSSMFGHTFLRIDPADTHAENLLLTNTISYAADAQQHDSEIEFAYRGIFGGYPGITVVEPYYQKLKIYNDIENRDLWEYQLDLTPTEVRTLLLHAWEIKSIRFDYYFFDENCAYRLFNLIDVARPGLKLTQAIPTLRAIPADTVKIAVDKDIVDKVTYRPANASIIAYQLDHLSAQQLDAVEAFMTKDFTLIDELTPIEAAEALETAYELHQYQSLENKLPRSVSAPISLALLRQRGRLPIQSEPRLPPTPTVRDDEGHDTLRLGLFGGQFDDDTYVAFKWRPAYHDLDDPLPGYRPGAHLQFFDTEIRGYFHNQELQLETFKFVEIISLSPRDRFIKPKSWQAGFGARRSWVESERRPLTPYADGFIGATYQTGPALVTAALTANAEVSTHLPSGGMVEAGIALLFNYQSETLRFAFKAEQRADVVKDNEARAFVDARLTYSLSAKHGLQVSVKTLASKADRTEDFSLGWYSYF